MIDADRYHHTGRTYVNIFRADWFFRPLFLGLTPQAMCLPPLRGSESQGSTFRIGPALKEGTMVVAPEGPAYSTHWPWAVGWERSTFNVQRPH